MLCGLIRTLLRIKKQLYLWIWRNKSGYFYCNGCCIGCKFFDDCMKEFVE